MFLLRCRRLRRCRIDLSLDVGRRCWVVWMREGLVVHVEKLPLLVFLLLWELAESVVWEGIW